MSKKEYAASTAWALGLIMKTCTFVWSFTTKPKYLIFFHSLFFQELIFTFLQDKAGDIKFLAIINPFCTQP